MPDPVIISDITVGRAPCDSPVTLTGAQRTSLLNNISAIQDCLSIPFDETLVPDDGECITTSFINEVRSFLDQAVTELQSREDVDCNSISTYSWTGYAQVFTTGPWTGHGAVEPAQTGPALRLPEGSQRVADPDGNNQYTAVVAAPKHLTELVDASGEINTIAAACCGPAEEAQCCDFGQECGWKTNTIADIPNISGFMDMAVPAYPFYGPTFGGGPDHTPVSDNQTVPFPESEWALDVFGEPTPEGRRINDCGQATISHRTKIKETLVAAGDYWARNKRYFNSEYLVKQHYSFNTCKVQITFQQVYRTDPNYYNNSFVFQIDGSFILDAQTTDTQDFNATWTYGNGSLLEPPVITKAVNIIKTPAAPGGKALRQVVIDITYSTLNPPPGGGTLDWETSGTITLTIDFPGSVNCPLPGLP